MSIATPAPDELLREVALAAKVCVRPVLLRCTDTEAGASATVPIPCGSTIERACPSCSDRARRLRMQQCREGWHREQEPPALDPAETGGGIGGEGEGLDLDGTGADDPSADDDTGADDSADDGTRRVRSTRRRQDVAGLPRVPMDARTTGRTFAGPGGKVYRPSLFLTLTLDSYGPVRPDGTPLDPGSCDYRRAALDALHFVKLEDRFWQNLRRCAGYRVQYFAAIEPQRRLAPHLHAAVRGVIPRAVVRQVIAGTYHQLWWPPCDQPVCGDGAALPVWNDAAGYLDPTTGAVLSSWEQALDDLDADPAAKPAHVLRFGAQMDYQGIIGTDEDTIGRQVAYLTKYLANDMAATHDDDVDLTPPQVEHLNRLHAHFRVLPCSPRCANWLRYGVQPKDAMAGLVPGTCAAKAHDRHHLGLGGRRVHVSRQWTGKTLGEHAGDRAEIVRQVLADAGIAVPDRDRCSAATTGADGRARFIWSKIPHHDQDALTYRQAITAAIRERVAWREQYEQAKNRAGPRLDRPSATEGEAAA